VGAEDRAGRREKGPGDGAHTSRPRRGQEREDPTKASEDSTLARSSTAKGAVAHWIGWERHPTREGEPEPGLRNEDAPELEAPRAAGSATDRQGGSTLTGSAMGAAAPSIRSMGTAAAVTGHHRPAVSVQGHRKGAIAMTTTTTRDNRATKVITTATVKNITTAVITDVMLCRITIAVEPRCRQPEKERKK